MKGVYLVFNQGTLVVEGKKTLIIKEKQVPKDYLDIEVYLCQDDLVLGKIKLNNEKLITLKEFEELKDKHYISENQRKTWWPDANSFYSYDVEVIEKFEKPKKFEYEQGIQNYIQEVKLKKEITTTDDIDHLEVLYDTEKLHLEEFKAEGVDYDLKHPKTKWKQLLADLRYLGNGGYPKLKAKEKWGDWDLETLLEYFAKIIDVLRSIYMPLMPKDDKNSFWDCYHEAEQYMKSKPPKQEEVAEWDKKREKLIKSIDVGQYVICENCDEEIDYLGTKECAMGAIACPNCKSIIDQYGSLLNKRYDAIAPSKLEKLTDEELEETHKEAHKIYQLYEVGKFKDLELLINNHILIVQEMLKRKIKHNKEDKLDEESLEFNRDYDKDEKELLFKHEELHSFDFTGEDNFYDFKSVLERHDEIVKSLENFGIQHNSKEDFLDDYVEFIKRRSNLAAVHPSGEHNKYREVIKLEEVLPYFKSFKLRSPFIYLTGSVVNREYSTNDIDILINCTQEELEKMPLFQMLTWRLMRSLPRRYWKKIQFLPNKWQGPITNNIPIYELACLRTNLDNKVFQMSHQDEDTEFIKALIRTKNPKSERQAQKAKRENKITLGEFLLQMKPTRGAFPNQRMNIDSFLSLFKEDDYPVWNCLHPSSLIMSNPNVKTIEQIQIGDKVFDASGNYSKVEDKFEKYYDGKLLKLKALSSPDIYSTKEHRFFVIKGSRCSFRTVSGNCKPSCQRAIEGKKCQRFYEKYKKEWLRAENLGVGDFLAIRKFSYVSKVDILKIPKLDTRYSDGANNNCYMKRIANNRIPNEIKYSKNLFKLLGLYLAEGCVNSDNGRVTFILGSHENSLKDFLLKTIKEEFGLKTTVRHRTWNAMSIGFSSLPIAQFFLKEFGSKAINKKIPTFVMFAEKDFVKSFIEGYYLGDGSSGNFDRYCFFSASKGLIIMLKLLLTKCDILGTIGEIKPKKVCYIKGIKTHSVGGFSLSISGKQVEKIDFLPKQKNRYFATKSFQHWFEDKDYFFVPIKKISEIDYQGKLIDLQTQNSSYTVNGIVCHNSKKMDGFNTQIHKNGKDIVIYSEDGDINTHRFPTLVEEVSKLNVDQCVLLTEIEMWIEKIHQPREAVSGYAHLKSEPDDSNIIANVYDIVFYNKDIHNLAYELRKQYLDKLNFKQSTNEVPNVSIKLNKIPHYLCKNKDELRRTTEKLRNIESSEGVVATMTKATFNLAGKRSGEIKFHNNAAINVVVLDRQTTKTKGVYNYYYGVGIENEKVDRNRVKKIGSNNYLLLGKTFSTTANLKTGDKFILEFETLNIEYHEKTDEIKLTCWVPRFIAETNEEVDTIKSTIAAAKKENHVLQEKDVLESGEIIYKSVEFEKQDPYEIIPEEDESYRYTVQRHFRGRTAHLDLRIQSKDKKFLIGWTCMDLLSGKIKEPILTMKDAAKANSEDNYKIEWNKKPAKVKMRRTAAGNIVPAEIRASTKAAEPAAWLDVSGITERGEVGATKEFPGVFTIIDQGVLSYGAQKSYFKEYFFSDKGKLQGRWVFRQISEYRRDEKTKGILPTSLPPERPETSGFFWVFIMPLDQTPYVISDRAVEKNWISPLNYSALPSELKKKVPSEFQYWKAVKESDRIRIRNAYVEWLKENKKYDELKKCGAIDISEGQRPRIDEVMILSSYLSCDIKDIFPKIISIPRVRAGNYLDALAENTKNCTLVEIRNFASCEIPPIYEDIQLKKNLTKTFLVEGFYFFHDEEKQVPFILQVAPVWGGFIVKIISRTKDKAYNLELSQKIEQYAKDNNMLKGEKFTISGEFIDSHNLTWEDIKLSATIKDRLKHLDYLIQNNEDGLASRGLLFLGPPGTGKTLTGKILSNSKPTFIWITSKDFAYTSMIGAVSTAFSLARELSPTIIFMEDLDSYVNREVVDLLKTELDGLQLNNGIFTILTSNFPEKLPEALIDRPGRFHDVLYFSLPNEEIRNEMFSHFLKDEEYDPEILEVLVRKTNGFSGAHVKEICDFGKIIKKEDNISLAKALMTSLDKVIEQRKLIMSFKNKNENILDIRNSLAYTKLLDDNEIFDDGLEKAIGAFKFVLQHHSFKRWNWKEDRPVIVVRSGKSEEHWDLRIDTGKLPIMHWVLDNDPREVQSTTALYKPCNDKSSMDKGKPNENKDYLKPGTSDWNPTKDTRAWLDLEDSGEAIITIDKPMFKRVELKGKTLKGLFTLEREDEKSDFWTLSKAKLPETKKETEEVNKK